jgi:hypothetical protein
MKKCQFETQVDDYLFDRLEEGDKEAFEEHYFNCPSCFQLMEERNELISAIKSRGAWIFKPQPAPDKRSLVPTFEKLASYFTPRQWATVAAAAAVLLVIVFGVLPRFKGTSPQFVLSESEVVRGGSLTLMSPIIDVRVAPAFFEWRSLGQDVEYKISLYNSGLMWTAVTKDNRIVVPEDIRQKMGSGEKFAWQVKAFSTRGTLIAVSSRLEFKINPSE